MEISQHSTHFATQHPFLSNREQITKIPYVNKSAKGEVNLIMPSMNPKLQH